MPKRKRRISYKKITLLLIKIALILIIIFVIIPKAWNYFNNREKYTDYQTEINAKYESIDPYKTEDRATVVVEKFVTDYYTLKYKESRSDIGATSLVYSDSEFYEGFITESKQTYYYNVDALIDNYGSKNLPAVSDTETTSSSEYTDVCHDAYSDCFESVYLFEVDISYDESDSTSDLKPPTQVYVGVGWHGNDYQVIFVSEDEDQL